MATYKGVEVGDDEETEGKKAGVDSSLPNSMPEEFALAKKEGRQPRCIYCGEPLSVYESQGIQLNWDWDKEQGKFIKSEGDGWSNKPECGECGIKDWEFTNNDFVIY